MEHQFRGTPLDLCQRNFTEQRDRVLVQFSPACRIEIAKKTNAIVIPAPPKISRQRPQPFLRRSDKAIESTSFAYDGSHLVGSLYEHANFSLMKHARIFGLDHENTLKNSAVNQGNTEE